MIIKEEQEEFDGTHLIIKQEISFANESHTWDYESTFATADIEQIKTEFIDECGSTYETSNVEFTNLFIHDEVNSHIIKVENEVIDESEDIPGILEVKKNEGPFSKFDIFCRRCRRNVEVFELENLKKCYFCHSRTSIRCKECNLRFTSTNKILDHSKKSCDRTALHDCKHCNYTTYDKSYMRLHSMAKHETVNQDIPEGEKNKEDKLSLPGNDCVTESQIKFTLSRHRKINRMQFKCSKWIEKCGSIHGEYQNFAAIEKQVKVLGIFAKTPIVVLDKLSMSEFHAQRQRSQYYKRYLKRIELSIKAFCSNCNKTHDCDEIKRLCSDCHRPNKFQCLEHNCGKYYSSIKYVRKHIMLDHVNQDQRVLSKCPTCGKVFGRHSYLLRHMKGCGKAPAIECKHCEYATKWESGLKKHMRAYHSEVMNEILPV